MCSVVSGFDEWGVALVVVVVVVGIVNFHCRSRNDLHRLPWRLRLPCFVELGRFSVGNVECLGVAKRLITYGKDNGGYQCNLFENNTVRVSIEKDYG